MVDFDASEIASIDEDQLPLYSVMVPLRGEERVVKKLVTSLSRLDYPKEKLQIMLLLEENDPSTVEAVARLHLAAPFEVYVLADYGPRTKPKACTAALKYVKGKYVVVFDAEDQVELDQLKKAYLAHERFGDAVWCIQAKLEYHNNTQNLLARLFSGEYATYFNLLLPALGTNDMLVPLGGTSNHFKTDKLCQMGGWDPYNVTEDLDLGIVISRSGGNVKVLNSVTWEEANSRLGIIKKGGWIPQRSRWIKGHMQSYLVHMRNPARLLKDLGLKNFLLFQLLVGGTPVALLLSPVFLLLTLLYGISRLVLPSINLELAVSIQNGIEQLFPPVIYYLGIIAFFAGNLGLTYYLLAGCMVRELYPNVKWMLFSPLYWQLMSIATWKAAFQLIRKPHHWEKSSHGHEPVPTTEEASLEVPISTNNIRRSTSV